MPNVSDYRRCRDAGWRLVVLPESWSEEFHQIVMARVREQTRSKHPQTLAFDFSGRQGSTRVFLKVFHSCGIADVVKDFFRDSKAKRFWRQGLALSAAGFNVPLTLAAGELRRFRILRRSFVVTQRIDGQPLPAVLEKFVGNRADVQSVQLKRRGLLRLAELIQKFHEHGFVHGDLVASNVLVELRQQRDPEFYFMDNDRTRCFPNWLPQLLWKRNLVQLNRMPLPGITLQDRVRFLCRYSGRRRLTKTDARLARWLEIKTRRRRHECDGVDPGGNFRRLMAHPIATSSKFS